SDQEVELGLISLAVPVIDPDGAIVAAMTLSASSVRISAEHLREEIMPRLREYADELANKL
ncbi:IclR family transcriptional regulator domain-containing protein, partial [Martelella sp. AMO21009]